MSDIDTAELEALAKRLATDLKPALQASTLAIALEVQDRIAPYPTPSRKSQPFKTAKQRRGFFARLRSGKITVPYPRQNDVLNRWSPVPTGAGTALRNTSPHAHLVHSQREQADYHKGTWTTDKGIADEVQNDGTATEIVEQAVAGALKV